MTDTTKSKEGAVNCKKPYEQQRLDIEKLETIIVVWLDKHFDENHEDCQSTITQLYSYSNDINTFMDNDQCIEFILDIADKNVCMIISGSMVQNLLPCIHDICLLDSIFLYCKNEEYHQQWFKQWSKIKGVFTDLTSICAALRERTYQCQQNAISMSFVGSKKRLDQLDPSFMYTQLIKEIMLTIDFGDKHIKEFIEYCPDLLHQYHQKSPIWWYTNPGVLYTILNCALRLLDGDIIVRMGFFINDLHRQIEQLHKQQFGTNPCGEIFTCYRGQGLSKRIFDEMIKSKGGLMSFNNFLSTSKNRYVSLFFAESNLSNPDLIGILFTIKIDPKQSTTPFASIRGISAIPDEDEVLFSMHTVFRIDDIKLISENNRLYEVNLILTSDNDKELNALTDQIRKDSFPDTHGWDRLGSVLIRVNQNEKAEEIFRMLLSERKKEVSKAPIYNELGLIKNNRGEYVEAIKYYEKAIAIQQQSLYSNHTDLASSYNNIGLMYHNMGEYQKALSYYEKSLTIQQQSLLPNHPDLAASYNNIGSVYYKMDDYPKALSYYEKSLVIRQQSLPSNHPDLGASYNNIGRVYYNLDNHSKALSYQEKGLIIQQKSLPLNHPQLAASYNNIGIVYKNMCQYQKALSYYEKSLTIQQQSLPPNHPDLVSSYNNMGNVYNSMDDYPKALSYYEKVLIIRQQSLPSNHPDFALSYNNIGMVYQSMGNYEKALSYHEKALAIHQQLLPPNHRHLASSYNIIGLVYEQMKNYPKAFSFYERAVQIAQQSLPSSRPNLQHMKNNLHRVRKKL
uniref:TPR repeat containing protein-like protein n=1 Tax=Adineta vaga TaxID=104782 RepID=B3G4E9_ADIVA|nr:TPR repeat containing protein-like protein [Adineta vaga]